MSRTVEPISDLVARLTSAQAEAVTSEHQRLAVYAGAGAGKTRVLTLRIARMVDNGVDPTHILAITFSKKAAQEMRRRLWGLGVEGIRTGTFHRTALELVEISRQERGLRPAVLITDRRRMLERLIDDDVARSSISSAFVDTEITWSKSQGLTPEHYVEAARAAGRRTSQSPHQLQSIWARYESTKLKQGGLDFDDLIIDAVDALRDPAFAEAIHWRSRHLLVDEFQDVNAMQFALIERLLAPSSSLFCVGDPNQSIYGFNGADPTLLDSLEQRMPGTRVIVLDSNHRSTPEIVSSAASVLSHQRRTDVRSTQNPGAIPELKGLATDTDEADFIARRIRELRTPGRRWRSFAVLARTNAQLRLIARRLEAAQIPTQLLAPDLGRASDVTNPADQRAAALPADDRDAVALGTFHRAKGLEWPTVFVIGVSEGLIPYRRAASGAALDEERRLLYVAMTRAEQELIVSWSAKGDHDAPAAATRNRSQFLGAFETALDALAAEQRPSPSALGAQRASQLREALSRQLETD